MGIDFQTFSCLSPISILSKPKKGSLVDTNDDDNDDDTVTSL